jgi:MFS family permease
MLRPAFVLTCLYSLLTMLAWAALFPTMPLYIRGPLGGGDIAVGLIMAGAPLIAGMAQPLLGGFADRHGRRPLIIGGPLIFAACLLLFPLAQSPSALFALRVAAGIGDSAFIVGGVTVLNDIAPEGRKGEAYSIYSLATWAGVGLGPVVADVLRRAVSFEAVWLAAAGFAIAASVVALMQPESRRAAEPADDRPRFFVRAAALPGLVLTCEIFGFSALLTFATLYANELGMAGAGPVLLVNAAVLVAMRVLGRRLPDRLGAGRAAGLGLSLSAVGLATPAVYAEPAGLYLGAGLFGAGHALSYPSLLVLAVARAGEHEASGALGSLKACEAVGQAAGATVLGAVAAGAGYGAVFGLAAAVTLIGLVPLRAGTRRRRPAVDNRCSII